jgi:hypothetical protein
MTKGIRTLVAALALGGLFDTPADAQDELPSGRLYALVVLDSMDPSLGPHMEKDRDNIMAFLKSGFGDGAQQRLLRITVLERDRVTTRNVLNHFKYLPVTPRDTVLCYFSGHGGTVKDASREHLLQLSGSGRQELLRRSDLRQAMKETKPRLLILLTDSCSDYVMPVKKKLADGPTPAPIGRDGIRPGCRRLFFEEAGVVDINATLEGTFAWSDHDGGLFTRYLRQCFEDVKDKETVNWSIFGSMLRGTSEKLFASWKDSTIASLQLRGEWNPNKEEAHEFLHKQATQAPQVYFLPGVNLGVGVKGTDGKGVRVIAFTLGSAVERAGVKEDEVIVGINGTPITTTTEWKKAVDELPRTTRQLELKVKNSYGKTRTVKVSFDS